MVVSLFVACTDGGSEGGSAGPMGAKGAFLELTPDVSLMAQQGDRLSLKASVRDARGNMIPSAAVEYRSGNPNVAIVDATGTVTGMSEGIVSIVGKSGTGVDTAVVSVAARKLKPGSASIAVYPSVDTIPEVGGTLELNAVARDASGRLLSNGRLSWKTLNESVATVSGNGTVRSLSKGVARIEVRFGELADTSWIWVAPAAGTRLVANPKEDTIPAVGGTTQLAANLVTGTASQVATNVSWSSLDGAIATVNASGLVQSKSKGLARIRVASGTMADTARVWVAPVLAPAVVAISPAIDTITTLGGTAQFSATVKDVNGNVVTSTAVSWSSLDASVASVSATGLVKAMKAGQTNIMAQAGSVTGTATVIVAPTPSSGVPASLSISPEDGSVALNDTLVLTAIVKDAKGNDLPNTSVTWVTGNAKGKIVGNGTRATVTGLALGDFRVYATAGAVGDTTHVYVVDETEGNGDTKAQFTVTPPIDTIPTIGGKVTLSGKALDEDGNVLTAAITWTSLDPGVAGVDAGGTVTGLKQGTARVRGSYNAMEDTAVVHVAPVANAPTVSVNHTPSSPSTSNNVTISATVSDPTAVVSTTILVDGAQVKTCQSGSCSYSNTYAAGTYSYTATALDHSGNTIHATPGSVTVWQTTSGGSNPGSAASPHWRHMRTATIDYRIHYQGANSAAEWDWAAAHYDFVVGGRLSEYKDRNPSIHIMTYDLLWAPLQSNAPAMEQWLQNNGYNPENAFLHTSGSPKSVGTRLTATIWNSARYIANPGDAGYQAWRAQRTKSLTAANGKGQRVDGLFFDEFGSGAFPKHIPTVTAEYSSHTAYYSDLNALIAQHKGWVPGGFNILNQANYFTKPIDMAASAASGGTMTEFVNTPYGDQRWSAIDNLVAQGVTVEFATGVASSRKNIPLNDMNSGNYGSVAERVLMWEYASYLMVVNPNRMDAVLFETYGLSWSVPMSVTWLSAFEHPIGLATGSRRVMQSGTDPAGQSFQVFTRDFENGFVLIRPRSGSGSTQYGNQTAVRVNLPAGTWKMLRPDGSVTSPLTSVDLRNGESAIFVR